MASLCAVSGTRQVSSPLLESPRLCLGCEIEETLNPFFVVASLFLFPSKEKKRDFTHLDAHATKRRRKKTCPRPSPRLLRSSFPADRVPVRSTLPLPLLFFVRVTRRRVPKERPTRERMRIFFFAFVFSSSLKHKFASKKKEVFDGKESGEGDLFETRRAREERWTRRDANARKRLFCARARVGSTTNRVARGRAKEVSEKMCAHECPMLLFGGVSPPFILFPLLCEGDASLGLGFDADIGDVVSSPSKTNEQVPELPSRPRPLRGQSPASNSTSKPSKTKSLAPSSPKSNARTTRLENRKSPRASKRSEP